MTRMPYTISREKMIEKAQALADSLYRDSKRSEHRVDRLVRWLFRHRHKWQRYKMVDEGWRTFFHCRECECGAKQIKHDGPMGDDLWHDMSEPQKTPWEQQRIETAKRLPPNTQGNRSEPA